MRLSKRITPVVWAIILAVVILGGGYVFLFSGTEQSVVKSWQNAEKPIDAVWISTNFYSNKDMSYMDLQRNGDFFSKKEGRGKTEFRFGSLAQSIITRAFNVVNTKGVLNVRNPGGEAFPGAEWVKVGMVIDGKTKSSPTTEIGNFPSDFQQLLKDLKPLAEAQPIAQDIKASIFSKLVDSQRVKSLKEDPRRFFTFVEVKESDLATSLSIKIAINILGRQIPLRDSMELQKIENYLKLSNLKSVTKQFFITFEGKSYELNY